MKIIWSLLLVGVLALGACAKLTSAPTAPAATSTNAAVTAGAQAALALVQEFDPSLVSKANAALSSLSGGSLAKACSYVTPAVGYANAAAPLISSTQVQQGISVGNAINAVCTNPPTSVASAIKTLSTLWAGIQAAATVPK